ncbi:MAG: PspC domain-containing protein [Sphingorhabdus sp.]
MTKLVLDRANKKVLGVCAGLANWSGIDVSMMRVIFVVATLIGVGSPILIYLILALILN